MVCTTIVVHTMDSIYGVHSMDLIPLNDYGVVLASSFLFYILVTAYKLSVLSTHCTQCVCAFTFHVHLFFHFNFNLDVKIANKLVQIMIHRP